eukprot:8687868-Pyramimonas_sp.AAC.3
MERLETSLPSSSGLLRPLACLQRPSGPGVLGPSALPRFRAPRSAPSSVADAMGRDGPWGAE